MLGTRFHDSEGRPIIPPTHLVYTVYVYVYETPRIKLRSQGFVDVDNVGGLQISKAEDGRAASLVGLCVA